MITMQECLDYCDLTAEEVDLIAAYGHIPHEIAIPIVCSLAQTEDGIRLISACLSALAQEAADTGYVAKAEHVLQVYAQFRTAHPLVH
jgi:hypothetical protein